MVCCLDDKYEQAEDLFEMATTYEPNNIIAWTMRGRDITRNLSTLARAPHYEGI